MFRRRPPRRRPPGRRRPLRPSRGPRPLPPRVRRALDRANRLMASQRFAQAAVIFDRLSEQASRRDRFVPAAALSLQSFRAHFSAGDVDTALERAREGLRLLIRGGRAGRVPNVLARMTAVLRGKGYGAQAGQLERQAAHELEGIGLSLGDGTPAPSNVEGSTAPPPMVEEARGRTVSAGSLPASCSGCGAPLIPGEVEWHDAHTAECLYCGAVVKPL
jgi:hypothetical protein